MLNVYVRTQVKVQSSEIHSNLFENGRFVTELGKAKCAGGRVDMVVRMPDTVYVFEFKKDGTAQQAMEQIDQKNYAIPYLADGRRVMKVGVKFNADTRVPEAWVTQLSQVGQ